MPGGFLGGLRRSGDCGRRHDGHRAADDGNAGDDSIDVGDADERDHGHHAGAWLPSVILPDKRRTPGALNPKVRRSTIKKTICKSGWTKTIRPPVAFTNALKIKQMVLYEETGLPSTYEEDHLIPLELGGAPRNPKNLWPEPRSQSKLSDPLETKLKRKVCRGLLQLAKARAAIRLFKNTQG
jgi:hypothetical protein